MSRLPMGSARRRKGNSLVAVYSSALSGPGVTISDKDDVRRQAVMDVIQIWMDRLQLVSVITTFFASTDGLVLSYSAGVSRLTTSDTRLWDPVTKLMNAALIGALIFHTCSGEWISISSPLGHEYPRQEWTLTITPAIIAFLASFCMIRYKLKNATRHQSDVLHHPERLNQATPILDDKDSTGSPAQGVEGVSTAQFSFLPPLTNFDFITNPIQNHISISRVEPFWFLHRRHNRAHGNESPIPIPPPPENDPEYQNDPTPQPVSELQSPVNLLIKCHTMSVTLASIGFILALVGILTFVWKALPQDVSIFATASLGVCALAGIIALS